MAVLFGGRSSEHEVSVLSAGSIIRALDDSRFEVIPVAIERSGRWLGPARSAALLPDSLAGKCSRAAVTVSHQPGHSQGVDVVFPALHGPYGEDGRLQGLLDLADVPYVGSGVVGSACGMDKDIMKRLFRESGLPTVRHVALSGARARTGLGEVADRIGFPAFVKPANLGSSVGVRRVTDPQTLESAVNYALEFDLKVIVEPEVNGREIECAVMGNDRPRASLPGEIVVEGGFYDYSTKYETNTARLEVPAQLAQEQVVEVQGLAVAAFQALDCAGLARVDVFLEHSSGKIWLNEVNTMPGFTAVSMFPQMWHASGIPYPTLVEKLIDLAFESHSRRQALRFDPS